MRGTAIARKSMEFDPHPKCPACGCYMKSFAKEPEQDCTGCGIVWALPTAY